MPVNILIIEDEPYAADALRSIVCSLWPEANVEPPIDSVEDAIAYIQSGKKIDLMFADIHLSDGHAFEIFASTSDFIPVIFTTAYDQYAIKAFEVNSIDYLLKPVSREQVQRALDKYEKQYQYTVRTEETHLAQLRKIQELITRAGVYKENFLIPFRGRMLPISVKDFAWFEIRNGVVTGTLFDKKSYIMEERSLEELAQVIDPDLFYRANRQYLINKLSVKEIAQYINGKLVVVVLPAPSQQVIVSREKATHFKSWMSR